MTKQVRQLDRVVIRFAGDSGDGMQLTGDRFTSETAQLGNDISTLPNFPAEIRAPAGTLPGVSSFQVHFADFDILTPGDAPNVLVAMNPAALKANLDDLPGGADIIVNTDEFTKRNLVKVGYDANPLEDGTLDRWVLHPVALTSMTVGALADFDISKKDAERAKNMFALGLLSWMYSRPHESTLTFLERKFAARPELAAANIAAFKAGWNFGETTEDFGVRYEVKPAKMPPGNYRNITGNVALALGLVAAGVRSKLPVFLGAYPITPASDILHELSKHKRFNVTTMQAEDEIAAVGAALGASLRRRARRHHHQRAGRRAQGRDHLAGDRAGAAADRRRRAAGRPVHRHADQDRAGRPQHGPVRPARRGPGRGDRTPVAVRLLLRRDRGGPDRADLPHPGAAALRRLHRQRLRAVAAARRRRPARPAGRVRHRAQRPTTARRSCRTCATRPRWPGRGRSPARPAWSTASAAWRRPTRPATSPTTRPTTTSWCAPGQPGSRRSRCPTSRSTTRTARARVLVLGWGSTYGPIGAACRALRQHGLPIAQAHLRHLNPMPRNLESVLKRYDRVVIPEMNLGQLAHVIRGRYLVDAIPYNQVRGLPFTSGELETMLEEVVKNV